MPTVIKAGQPTRAVRPALARIDLADHLAHARVVVEEAQQRADAILADARARAESLTASARQDGYQAGYAEGLEAGRRKGFEAGSAQGREEAFDQATERFQTEQAAVVADLRRLVEHLDEGREQIRVAARRDVVEFAVRFATRLTFAIGSERGEAAAANLERALKLVQDRSRLTARVHPRDIESLRTFAAETLEGIEAADGLTLVADASIHPGGCVLQADRTEVDARLETQIDELVSLLLGGGRPATGLLPAGEAHLKPADDETEPADG